MQKLLVSIVIATYNRARLLGQAIQSIVEQTYRPLEAVVVDDGSTDETRDKVLALERRWSPGRDCSCTTWRRTMVARQRLVTVAYKPAGVNTYCSWMMTTLWPRMPWTIW